MIKKLLLVVALFIPTTVFAADQVFSISEFAGGVDVTDISQLDPKYSPFDGIMNVWTDEDGTVSKRRGIAKDNLTALSGNLPITRGYVYNQNDGDSYKIVYSSSSVFYSLGDGTYTALISTLNASYVPDFTTAQGNLYFSNGYDSPYKWDGATLTELTVHNSTDVEKARYIEYWRGYMLWAGVDNYRSRVYVSKVDYPDYVYQFIDINPDDGQVITGMLVTEDGKVLITKERSTYQLTELYTNELIFSQVSATIGCLYNTSMTILKGFPVWCSHRGIEMFTGEFNLLSEPIDNTFSGLKQLNAGQKIITYDTATDWGRGSGVNIDTTTTSGSVSIPNPNILDYASGTGITGYAKFNFTSGKLRQRITPNATGYITSIKQPVRPYAGYYSGNIILQICDSAMNVLFSSMTAKQNYNITLDTPLLVNGSSTYYVVVSSGVDFVVPIGNAYVYGYLSDLYSGGALSTSTYGTAWGGEAAVRSDSGGGYVYDMELDILITSSATYTTYIAQATGFASWQTFNVNDNQPDGTNINYYFQTSTASDNFSSRPYYPIINGQKIYTSAGEYVSITSSITMNSATLQPSIDKINITYNSGSNIPIVCDVSGDRLFVSVSTGTNNYNDAQFILQSDGSWTKHTGFVGAYMDFRNVFYYGSSLNGQIYQTDIDGYYYDDGGDYESYWTTKLMQGHPFYRGLYKCLWVTAENSGDWNLNTDYRFDGSAGAYVSRYISLNKGTGNVYAKSAIAAGTNVRGIQYRIGNNIGGQYFKIKRLDLIYDDKWSIE